MTTDFGFGRQIFCFLQELTDGGRIYRLEGGILTNTIVPAAILLTPELSASAKLIWMLLQLADAGTETQPLPQAPKSLVDKADLAPGTVRRAVGELRRGGWLAVDGGRPSATVPSALLLDRDLGVQEKLLYAAVQLTPGFSEKTGQFTFSGLSALTHASTPTLRQAAAVLKAFGWLDLSQRNKFDSIVFKLRNPCAERCERMISDISERLKEADYRGEAIMQEYLSGIIDRDDHIDHARPAFLKNPYSGENLHFDRWYPPDVAFEFNGQQHYGPTEMYPSTANAERQQGRDLIKFAICTRRGIDLIVVHPQDLSLATLLEKVPGRLPLRDLVGQEPITAHLEEVSERYRRRAGHVGPTAERQR